ncbi:hypothetical protein HAX54_050602 [Datura stramonium]|uniref:Uncharacterized protein n=1 Tax=Datura stramonium TaxID=4076 RepID=A0ABS8SYA8_DATST|nr:hypothetical protein [Datura stramonium]
MMLRVNGGEVSLTELFEETNKKKKKDLTRKDELDLKEVWTNIIRHNLLLRMVYQPNHHLRISLQYEQMRQENRSNCEDILRGRHNSVRHLMLIFLKIEKFTKKHMPEYEEEEESESDEK